jgi:predicted fused transcriptional regulator/phosphomethylpyrimidine kinase
MADPDPMGPIDPSAFNAAKAAWYADRDRILADVIPQVDRAIAEMDSWATTVNSLVALIGQMLPIIQTLATTAPTPAAASTSIAQLTQLKSKLANLIASCPA